MFRKIGNDPVRKGNHILTELLGTVLLRVVICLLDDIIA